MKGILFFIGVLFLVGCQSSAPIEQINAEIYLVECQYGNVSCLSPYSENCCEEWWELEGCIKLDSLEVFGAYHPNFLILVDGKNLSLSSIWTDKVSVFNASSYVYEWSDGVVYLSLFDEYGRELSNPDDFIRCGIGTINRLIELNATDIVYDVCIETPRVVVARVQAKYWRTEEEEHQILVCEGADDEKV